MDASASGRLAREWVGRRAEVDWARVRAMQGREGAIAIDIVGRRYLEDRQEGQGTVLWFQSFCDSGLLMRGLAEIGLPVVHLSAVMHGSPGNSRLGRRVVGPLFCRATFALRTGARLLTCFMRRIAPTRYEVVIEAPVLDERQRRPVFLEAALAEYALRLQRNVGDHPADWEGWYWLERLTGG